MEILNTPFPAPSQLDSQYCFLSPNDEQERLRIDLNHSLILKPLDNPPLINSRQLAHILSNRYGGSPSNWGIQQVSIGFLVKLAEWVSNDHIYHDDAFWLEKRFTINTWWALQSSSPLPPPVDVVIAITGFPTDFQHPFYYRQATTGMGTLTGVLYEGMQGEDRRQVRLMLRCYAVELIPSFLYVGHGGRWTKCSVRIEDGILDGAREDPPPPLSPEEIDLVQATPPEEEEEEQRVPYIPPWRRRLLVRQQTVTNLGR